MTLRPSLTEVLMDGGAEWEREWGEDSDRQERHNVPRRRQQAGSAPVGGRVARR